MHVASCYIGPRYDGTGLYLDGRESMQFQLPLEFCGYLQGVHMCLYHVYDYTKHNAKSNTSWQWETFNNTS